jgi:CRISPR-associated protein Cas1
MRLIVSNFGSFVGKKSERLVVKESGRIVTEVPFFKLEQVLITTPGASISSDVIRECALGGIPITFLSYNGTPYAQIQSPHLQGTVQTRRAQMLAYINKRGLILACAFAGGKIGNQINLLKYMAKYRKQADIKLYEKIQEQIGEILKLQMALANIEGINVDDARQNILNIEGRSANLYWQAISEILPKEIGFASREKRGASDLTNCLLNYGYGILYSQVQIAIILAGLDPYAGFLHVDRPGKPSLVLDLIEEFRQPVVDRTVFGMLGHGAKWKVQEGMLDETTRLEVAEKILGRLDAKEFYQGKKYTLRTIIQRQARSVATFVRGEGKYRPFIASW